MRALGVNGSGKALYLSVAVDGKVEDAQPYTLAEPAGLAADMQLPALRDEVVRILQALNISRVRVLDAEPNYKASYSSLQPRIALESVVLLAAADAGVEGGRLTRARLRSLLELPRGGGLKTHVAAVTSAVGGSWSPNKRDLAALAALAAVKE